MQFAQKSFGNRRLFTVDKHIFSDGKIHGLLGPNGAGKTTLLRMIGGLDNRYEGQILCGGKRLTKASSMQVTYVSQKPYMLHGSVLDNVAYPLKIRGVDRKERHRIAMGQLEALGIEELSSRRARVLSAGEKEKVSLARGLVIRPRLLLLDEPTGSVDPDTVQALEKAIFNYQRESGSTVIIVTHSLEQSLRLCDCLVALRNQELQVIDRNDVRRTLNELGSFDQLLSDEYKLLGV